MFGKSIDNQCHYLHYNSLINIIYPTYKARLRILNVLNSANTLRIRPESNITGALNGPQGHVSAKTVNSVQLMEWGLGRLADILSSVAAVPKVCSH